MSRPARAKPRRPGEMTPARPQSARGRGWLLSGCGSTALLLAALYFCFAASHGGGVDAGRALPHRKLIGTLAEPAAREPRRRPGVLHPGDRQLFGTGSLAALLGDGGAAPAGAPAAGEERAPVPPDFDWQAYVALHPKLFDGGITTEAAAREHYQLFGARERLLHKRPRVIMRYSACTGLVNQLYSHIAALALAAFLGTEVVLPPAAKRDSFAHYFSMVKAQNEVQWSAAPLEDLLDVDHLISFWADRGLAIRRAPQLEPFPDLTDSAAAFIPYPLPDLDPRFQVRLGGLYQGNLELGELVARARAAVVGRAEQLLAEGLEPTELALELPCSFFMLRTVSNLPLVKQIARSLVWSPAVAALAQRVVAGMAAAGDADFNSLHLRIEKDARDWAAIMGGEEVVWEGYVTSMRQAHFNAGRAVYIASGLLTYGGHEELDALVGKMRALGLCRGAHYKELYLPREEIEALNSEQKALLDLLVLAQGHAFVGFGASTFSFYLREYRSLAGIPPSRSILVDASAIGTDNLFAQAGRIS